MRRTAARKREEGVPDSILPLSWRDPSGRLFKWGDRLIRTVDASGVADLNAALSSKTLAQYCRMGNLISVETLHSKKDILQLKRFLKTSDDFGSVLLEHPKVSFPSFPYEWPAEMLFEAALLTLDLALALVDEKIGLKDASAYNILFQGTKPVFVDWLSFERRLPGDAQWLPFAQFARHFLNPLLLAKRKNISLTDIFLKRRDGVDAIEVYNHLSWRERWLSPSNFYQITLPTLLSGGNPARDGRDSHYIKDSEKAEFIYHSILKGLRRQTRRLSPKSTRRSMWSRYMHEDQFVYDENELKIKESFVTEIVSIHKSTNVLDIGANTGHFSILAARSGAQVVAIDFDEISVGEIFRTAKRDHLAILPLVVDFGRPSPAVGWKNKECESFLDRARGKFDLVLMLAVVHHLIASERIPLGEIVELASEITTNNLVIEYIDPSDRQFQSISRGRDYRFVTAETFETALQKRFRINKQKPISSTRSLYHLVKKI